MSLLTEEPPVAELPVACAPAPQSGSMSPWLGPTIVAALGLIAIFAFSPNFRWQEGPKKSPYAGDFLQEWIGGYVVLAGDHSRFYDPSYARQLEHDPRVTPQRWHDKEYLPLVYPPFYYALVSPLARLPLVAAAWVWAALMSAALVAAMASLWRAKFSEGAVGWVEARNPPLETSSAFWLLPAAVFFLPVIESLTSSQKGTVCLLILAVSYSLLNSGRGLAAGLVFGLLAFKPQLAIVIGLAMLVTGQWRFVAGAAISVAVLVGLSLAMGLDICRQYVEFALHAGEYMRTAGYDLHKSHTLAGFVALLLGDQPSILASSLLIAATVGVVGLVVRLLWSGMEPGTRRFDLQFSGLVAATILLSPHLFTYDLAMLLVPIFLLGGPLLAGDAPVAWKTGPLPWLLVALYLAPGISVSLAAVYGLQITVPLLVAFLALLGQLAAADEAVANAAPTPCLTGG